MRGITRDSYSSKRAGATAPREGAAALEGKIFCALAGGNTGLCAGTTAVVAARVTIEGAEEDEEEEEEAEEGSGAADSAKEGAVEAEGEDDGEDEGMGSSGFLPTDCCCAGIDDGAVGEGFKEAAASEVAPAAEEATIGGTVWKEEEGRGESVRLGISIRRKDSKEGEGDEAETARDSDEEEEDEAATARGGAEDGIGASARVSVVAAPGAAHEAAQPTECGCWCTTTAGSSIGGGSIEADAETNETMVRSPAEALEASVW